METGRQKPVNLSRGLNPAPSLGYRAENNDTKHAFCQFQGKSVCGSDMRLPRLAPGGFIRPTGHWATLKYRVAVRGTWCILSMWCMCFQRCAVLFSPVRQGVTIFADFCLPVSTTAASVFPGSKSGCLVCRSRKGLGVWILQLHPDGWRDTRHPSYTFLRHQR